VSVFAVFVMLTHDALTAIFFASEDAVLTGGVVVAGPATGEALCAAYDDWVSLVLLGLREVGDGTG
jgi:hypothetical protein